MRTLIYYTDPAHGWLHVPADCLRALGLTAADFSKYSYVGREGALYLEEDCDMPKFMRAYYRACGKHAPIQESYSARDSFVRGMPRNVPVTV
jgi:hypothetical protein